LIAKTSSSGQWADITQMVFNGATPISLIFKMKVDEAKLDELQRKRVSRKAEASAAKRQKRLEEMRASDVDKQPNKRGRRGHGAAAAAQAALERQI
jgi:uncharacterized alpha-E superfamily protein